MNNPSSIFKCLVTCYMYTHPLSCQLLAEPHISFGTEVFCHLLANMLTNCITNLFLLKRPWTCFKLLVVPPIVILKWCGITSQKSRCSPWNRWRQRIWRNFSLNNEVFLDVFAMSTANEVSKTCIAPEDQRFGCRDDVHIAEDL